MNQYGCVPGTYLYIITNYTQKYNIFFNNYTQKEVFFFFFSNINKLENIYTKPITLPYVSKKKKIIIKIVQIPFKLWHTHPLIYKHHVANGAPRMLLTAKGWGPVSSSRSHLTSPMWPSMRDHMIAGLLASRQRWRYKKGYSIMTAIVHITFRKRMTP